MSSSDKQIQDSITGSSISDVSSFAIAQRMMDEVSHARRVNIMAEAALAKYLGTVDLERGGSEEIKRISDQSNQHMVDLINSFKPPPPRQESRDEVMSKLKDMQKTLETMVSNRTTSINDL